MNNEIERFNNLTYAAFSTFENVINDSNDTTAKYINELYQTYQCIAEFGPTKADEIADLLDGIIKVGNKLSNILKELGY